MHSIQYEIGSDEPPYKVQFDHFEPGAYSRGVVFSFLEGYEYENEEGIRFAIVSNKQKELRVSSSGSMWFSPSFHDVPEELLQEYPISISDYGILRIVDSDYFDVWVNVIVFDDEFYLEIESLNYSGRL